MYETKQKLWDTFEKKGDIFSYLAYRGCTAKTDKPQEKPETEKRPVSLG